MTIPPFVNHQEEVKRKVEEAMEWLQKNKSIRRMLGENGKNGYYELTALGRKPTPDQKVLLDALRTLPESQIHQDFLHEVKALWRIGSYDIAIHLVMTTIEHYARKAMGVLGDNLYGQKLFNNPAFGKFFKS